MPINPIVMPHPGYNLVFTFGAEPTADEKANFADCAVALREARPKLDENETLVAEVGTVSMTLLQNASAEQCARLRALPVLRERRGTPSEPITIDGEVWKDKAFDAEALAIEFDAFAELVLADRPQGVERAARRPEATSLPTVLMRIGALHARQVLAESGQLQPIVIAVIDSEFAPGAAPDALPTSVGPIEFVALRGPKTPPSFASAGAHGTLMTHVIAEILDGTPARIRRIQIPSYPDATAYVTPANLSVAIAHAVAPREQAEGNVEVPPPADIVVIAMSTGQWGTPEYLDAIVAESARIGRKGKGAIIVASTGSPGDNQSAIITAGCDIRDPANRLNSLCRSSARQSAAHGADELGAHPDIILVGPSDIGGRWQRRFGDPPVHRVPGDNMAFTGITGRMGPSVTVAAPGVVTYIDSAKSIFDESSLASALVAGVVGQVLLANPSLNVAEVRRLLAQTAMIPATVDTPYGAESSNLSSFARDGHNFKIGAGMVNALGAVLAASDPIALMLIQIAVPTPPSAEVHGFMGDPALLIARWFEHWVRHHAPHADGYRLLRHALARLVMQSWPLRDELGWILRHLLAIFTHDGTHAWFTPFRGVQTNHGALRRRFRHLTRTLRQELEMHGEQLGISIETSRTWVNLLDERLAIVDDASVERFLRGAFLGYGVDLTEAMATADAHLAPFAALGRHELVDDSAG